MRITIGPFRTIRLMMVIYAALVGCDQVNIKNYAADPVSHLEQNSMGLYSWKQVKVNGGGYTNFLITDPKSPGTVYAGVNVGGMYKSDDYGETWYAINKGLDWPGDMFAAALTIDSIKGIMYFGVGGFGKGGLFKSSDSGDSWQLLSREILFNAKGVKQSRGKGLIVVDPSDSRIVYAGSYKDGLFKSVNSGASWSNIGLQGKYISSIVINHSNPLIIYVAAVTMGKQEGGIYKSTDGGSSWKRVSDKITEAYQLEMDPTDPSTIYAACGRQGIFKTADEGKTWSDMKSGWTLSNLSPHYRGFISLAIDLKTPEVIYAGSGSSRGQIFKSVNRGSKWIKLTKKKNIHHDGWWLKEMNWPGGSQYSANCISIDPKNSNRIYISGRSGVWRSDNGGETWVAKVHGLEGTVMNRVVVDPKEKGIFYAGNTDYVFFYTLDNGKTFLRTVDGMGNWDIIKDKNIYLKYRMKNGRDFAIDPRTNPGTIYIGGDATNRNSGAVFKSLDGGRNWKEANYGLPVAKVSALAIDPNNYDVLYAALSKKGIYKTVNGGDNWQSMNNGLSEPDSLFKKNRNKILINPISSDIVYVLDVGKGIYKTVDGGINWRVITKGLPKRGFAGMIHYTGGFALNPGKPDTLYVGLYKHGIYRTLNGGERWEKVTPPYIMHGGSMDIDHQDGTVYAASVPEQGDEDINNYMFGLFRSTDEGNSWHAIHNDELLRISFNIKDLVVDPHYKGRLYISTMGNGIVVGEPYQK